MGDIPGRDGGKYRTVDFLLLSPRRITAMVSNYWALDSVRRLFASAAHAFAEASPPRPLESAESFALLWDRPAGTAAGSCGYEFYGLSQRPQLRPFLRVGNSGAVRDGIHHHAHCPAPTAPAGDAENL